MSVVSVLEETYKEISTICENAENESLDENILALLGRLKQSENKETANTCLFEIEKTLRRFPPALNSNKFLYGKIIEIVIGNFFKGCGLNTEDLDEKVSGNEGACYINDIRIDGEGLTCPMSLSIKAQKGGSPGKPIYQDITIVNKNSKNENNECYNISDKVCFIVMHISRKRLYIFRNTAEFKEKYITETGSQVKYKSKIFNELNDKGQYYQFEDLTQEQYEIIDKLVPVNPNQILYEKYIAND